MPPPIRSPTLPHPETPLHARTVYAGATPQSRRASEILARSPTRGSRRAPQSPTSSSGFTSPSNMDTTPLSSVGPPLNATEELFSLQTPEGQSVHPDIFGKIDKGFFLSDGDWTCYRRNYFQLSCSYTLNPFVPVTQVQLNRGSGSIVQVYGFAMTIAAVVDDCRDGKAIDLVQHTAKRDKGPQGKPDRRVLSPRPTPAPQMYGSGDNSMSNGTPSIFDQRFNGHPAQPPTETTFDRIQFKQATANNGKRRAAQQYYHLVVELYADTGAQMGADRYLRVAIRTSAAMVVRGRSPGHYQGERGRSNSSAGPSGGNDGAGTYGSTSMSGRSVNDPIGTSSSSAMLSSGNYQGSYDTRSHNYSHVPSLPLPIPSQHHAEIASPSFTNGSASFSDEKPIYEPSSYYNNYGPFTTMTSSPSLNARQPLPPFSREYALSPEGGYGVQSAKLKVEQWHLPSLTAGRDVGAQEYAKYGSSRWDSAAAGTY